MKYILQALLVLALLLAVAATTYRVYRTPWQEWNDSRMARAVSVLQGYELYYPAGQGPQLTNLYAPFGTLFYLPAALAADTPSSAIRLGAASSFLIATIPVWWVLGLRAGMFSVATLGVFAAFWLFLFHTSMFAPFGVHADAPALGFGLLACGFILSRKDTVTTWEWVVLAVCIVLSVGSKQTMVGLPIAIASYVAMTRGRRAAVTCLVFTAVTGVGVIFLLTPVLSLEGMLFNAVVVPSSQPWRGDGGAMALAGAFRDLAPRVFPAVFALVGVGALEIVTGRLRRDTLMTWSRDNGWLLVLLVALVNVPLSLSGRAKLNGAMNTLSFTAYFIYVAAAMALVQLGQRGEHREIVRATRAVVLGMVLTAMVVWTTPMLPNAFAVLRSPTANPEEVVFDYARIHPEQVYLPFNPLITLMSEGRAYHFSTALHDLALAGHDVDGDHFARWIPADLRVVLLPSSRRRYEDPALRLLPEFQYRRSEPELPGWDIWGTDAGLGRP